jgi:hypothetical protein
MKKLLSIFFIFTITTLPALAGKRADCEQAITFSQFKDWPDRYQTMAQNVLNNPLAGPMNAQYTTGVGCTAKCTAGQKLHDCVTPTQHKDACAQTFANNLIEEQYESEFKQDLCGYISENEESNFRDMMADDQISYWVEYKKNNYTATSTSSDAAPRVESQNSTSSTETMTVSGTVLDTDNEPLIGATISYDQSGTPVGTTTDINGRFELKNVPSNAELEVSYVGHYDKKIKPGENQKIVMMPNAKIDDVVVVACGGDKANGIKSKTMIDGECYPSACVEPRWKLSGTEKKTKCVEQKCKIDNGTGEWTADGDTWKCILSTCKNGYDRNETNNTCDDCDATAVDKNATTGTTKQVDGKMVCVITDCAHGYKPNKDGTKCVAGELSEADSQAKIDELKENAQAMKDKEQSTTNKLLGAAGIGATGIGGMQLASALSEEKADAEAETAMRAYLATFHCNYGGGKNIASGETNVELPGGNELINLYSEYVNLANDLKVRKTALDMRPGIESESILDAATSGLYDDVAIGKTSGAYTSLARALMDPTGADAATWAAQKQETAKKKETSMITAGVGAAGSLVGNLALNSGKDKQNKVNEILNKYDKKKKANNTVDDKTIQDCIDQIVQYTYYTANPAAIKISCDKNKTTAHTLTKEETLSISKNWNYDNIKLYNSTEIEAHEKDACETLKKLRDFMQNKKLCTDQI